MRAPASTAVSGRAHGVAAQARKGSRRRASIQVAASCARHCAPMGNVADHSAPSRRARPAFWYVVRPPLLVGLDVTMTALLEADVELAAAHASSAVPARFLAKPMDGYLAFYESVRQTPPGSYPCHDLLAVMAAAEQPVITETATWPLAVDTGGGAAWGATVADRRPVPESTLGGFAPWRVALACDPAPFRAAVQSLFAPT